MLLEISEWYSDKCEIQLMINPIFYLLILCECMMKKQEASSHHVLRLVGLFDEQKKSSSMHLENSEFCLVEHFRYEMIFLIMKERVLFYEKQQEKIRIKKNDLYQNFESMKQKKSSKIFRRSLMIFLLL